VVTELETWCCEEFNSVSVGRAYLCRWSSLSVDDIVWW